MELTAINGCLARLKKISPSGYDELLCCQVTLMSMLLGEAQFF